MQKDWKKFDLRKEAGYIKWIKGEGDKIIELEKVKYKTAYPYKIEFSTFSGEGKNSTEFAKSEREAMDKINNYMKSH